MSMNRSLFKLIIVLCIQSIGLTCISAQNLEDPFNEAMKLFNDYDMMEYAPNHFYSATQKQYEALWLLMKSNNPKAKQYIDQLNRNGYTLPSKGYTKDLESLAKKGDIRAMAEMGQCYQYALNTVYDFNKAEKWYIKCNKKYLSMYRGNPQYAPAEVTLANNIAVYSFGIILFQKGDKVNGTKNLGSASDAGFLPAKYELAHLFGTFENNETLIQKSKELYKQAAELGDRLSQRELTTYWNMAAENHDARCQQYLGQKYFWNEEYEKAYKWFVRSYDGNDNNAPRYIGMMLENGYYLNKDINKAIEFYREAIRRKGDRYSYFFLGNLLYKQRMFDEAFRCLKRAAEGGKTKVHGIDWIEDGLKEAYRPLSNCYRYGLGVKENAQMADYWFNKAVESEDRTALELLKLSNSK